LQTERRCLGTVLASEINQPHLPELMRRFLYDQLYPNSLFKSSNVALTACPNFSGLISVFNSALATFYAPSDPSGIGGMHREHIRATPSWRQGPARYDCVLVQTDGDLRGMDVVRILLFFSFSFDGIMYPCALVRWYSLISEDRDNDTGMWMVEPDVKLDGSPAISVIHLDCICRAVLLLPIYGDACLPKSLSMHDSLDAFVSFYVNKYADHHAFEMVS
jgi:hypothetical protein